MRPLALAALASALLAGAAAAAKPVRTVDQVWLHPDFASFGVRSIAMLPVAEFGHDLEAEKQVQGEWGRAFAAAGYRWVSATTTRNLVRAAAGGDSLLWLLKKNILANVRIDSLAAPQWCARFRTDAVLSVRIDQWVQNAIEPDQSGKPSTSVQVKAALVDSTGQLLWSMGGSETVEGVFYEPMGDAADRSGTAGTRSRGLGGATTGGMPPPFGEALVRLFTRWAKIFPVMPAAAPAR